MIEYFVILKFEWLIAAIVFILLFIKIGKAVSNEWILALVQSILLLGFIAGFIDNRESSLFGNMFRSSPLIAFQKNLLLGGTYLITLLFSGWLKKNQHLPEFLILMLSALLGMCLMISSGNFLIFFLSLELSTIPVAAMANFDLDKRISSEAAMKMILSSAFSSGILLFGISLIYGVTGSIQFSEIPARLAISPLTAMAFVFLFTAFAFKLSIVPFHLWTADVYEGSPMPNAAFLSVISKASIAFIMTNTLYTVFQSMENVWYFMLVILSVFTMVAGNLFAIRQENIKRFLAFSSIAQVGFILVGMSNNGHAGMRSVTYFILVYVFSNLAAFSVASIISVHTGKEKISEYKGLYKTNPFLSWVLALALFSLAGIPPTAGFFAKLFLLTAGAEKGRTWFILVAALNMIISLYYYLNLVRSVFMAKNEHPIKKIRPGAPEMLGLLICVAGILFSGLFSWIYEWINELK